jgi:hypothetical protein
MSTINLTGPGGMTDTLITWVGRWHRQLGFEVPIFRGPFETTVQIKDDGSRKTRAGRFDQAAEKLLNNLPWATEHRTDFKAFQLDLRRMVSECKFTLDPTSATPRVPVGKCPAILDEGVECGTPLRADPFADHIRCWACGSRWNKNEWLLLGSVLNESD